MLPWLQLARISNLPTVWTNVTAAWLVAGGGWQDARLLWLILAGSLLYTGGMILNDAADVKFDREHRRERPIPSGQVSLRAAWGVGLGMLLVGAWLAFAKAWAHPLMIAGLVLCILFYDLYHKPWAGSVIVMGGCRAFLVLMTGSALVMDRAIQSTKGLLEPAFRLTGDSLAFLAPGNLTHATALGCYIVGITMAARSEHKGSALGLTKRLLAIVLLAVPVFAAMTKYPVFGPWDGLVYMALGWLLSVPIGFISKGGPSIGRGVGWLLAGIVIVDALAVATVSVPLALLFACLAPVLRFWQRWVAAT
ncbi:MAG: UbiA family prenyltransferase [Verrucomicrobiaceae bacterium]